VTVSDASLIGRSASVAINVRPPQLAASFAILNYRRDVACCAGFSDAGMPLPSPCSGAGVREAPREEIAGGDTEAGQRALWGFDRGAWGSGWEPMGLSRPVDENGRRARPVSAMFTWTCRTHGVLYEYASRVLKLYGRKYGVSGTLYFRTTWNHQFGCRYRCSIRRPRNSARSRFE
jgi:hypothetical protein